MNIVRHKCRSDTRWMVKLLTRSAYITVTFHFEYVLQTLSNDKLSLRHLQPWNYEDFTI